MLLLVSASNLLLYPLSITIQQPLLLKRNPHFFFFCYYVDQIKCRYKLEEEGDKDGPVQIQTYGDLGAEAFGVPGRCLTELLVLISYAGTAVSYLFFMGENLSSVFSSNVNSPSASVFVLLLSLEAALSFIRSFSVLAPFSIFADACNVLAMAIVLAVDVHQLGKSKEKDKRSAFNGAWSLPFAGGVAVFCFEAFGLTLSLEASMAERRKFPWVLLQAFLGIGVAYICFGVFGYLAYGDHTNDIITLNLPSNWLASIVKASNLLLSIANAHYSCFFSILIDSQYLRISIAF